MHHLKLKDLSERGNTNEYRVQTERKNLVGHKVLTEYKVYTKNQ